MKATFLRRSFSAGGTQALGTSGAEGDRRGKSTQPGRCLASLQRPDIRLESLKEDIKEFFKISGWERKLQNAVYSELNVYPLPRHPAAPPEHLKEPLVYMRKA